jgi:hypothetical protein
MSDALEPTAVSQREHLVLDPAAVTQGVNTRLAQLERRLVANEELARAGAREQFRVREVLARLEARVHALTEGQAAHNRACHCHPALPPGEEHPS